MQLAIACQESVYKHFARMQKVLTDVGNNLLSGFGIFGTQLMALHAIQSTAVPNENSGKYIRVRPHSENAPKSTGLWDVVGVFLGV